MQLIKLALFSLLIFALVITGISFLFPGRVRISRATNLAASDADSVFTRIDNRERWAEWHPWFQAGTANTTDVKMEWTAKTDSTRTVRLSRQGLRTLDNNWQVYRYPGADSITLQWYIDFHNRWYPWEKFGSLFYEQTHGATLEKGLSNLKQRLREQKK